MFRRSLSLVLASTFFLNFALVTKAAGRAQGSTPKPTLKEKALAITPGTMVEVRLLTKEKIRGRIGDLTDEGFSLQTAQGTSIQKRSVSFNELKSIKSVGSTGSKVGKGVAYGLAGVGAFVLILVIVCATGGCGG